ncbi:hypothetical protein OOK60_08165 [Trichothermofontia sichuanensis B231]|uniref:hypothetical protein n=1 Tax=Trichothermofontia sichuanensis TaxID=3045816 RepID=UPI002245CF3F|nr:hypothetical protein [Trichothermofontia sichuanensis]UZQ56021.1 hypothetical protein OOK60_08165 [Trichothermofontia sichuanensis B231]
MKGARFCQTGGSKLLLRDRYQAVRQLGEGGSGRTFLAIDEDRFQAVCLTKAQRLYQWAESPQIPHRLAHFDQTLTPSTASSRVRPRVSTRFGEVITADVANYDASYQYPSMYSLI